MVNEAEMQTTEHGLVPKSDGWWVLNARDARWVERDGRGHQVPFTGWTAEEAEGFHGMLGVNLAVLSPGQPLSIYHLETDQEGFLVVAGEALLIIEGEERPLKQWDYVHCPVDCAHTIIGAGDGPCVIVAASSRVNMGGDNWGAYTVDPVAQKHNAGVDEETTDPALAYARWQPSKPTKYGGWLPGD
jgi:uncharacterized cupin superfamily protein